MSLAWSRSIEEDLRRWAESCYPFEGCGVLVGEFLPGGLRKVRRFVPLLNQLRARASAGPGVLEAAREILGERAATQGHFEFVMDPAAFHQVMEAAAGQSLDVVGVLHTHPDHPARPSATDAAQPLLAGWSNVILSVQQGRFQEARSWVREEETSPFVEEPIDVL